MLKLPEFGLADASLILTTDERSPGCAALISIGIAVPGKNTVSISSNSVVNLAFSLTRMNEESLVQSSLPYPEILKRRRSMLQIQLHRQARVSVCGQSQCRGILEVHPVF